MPLPRQTAFRPVTQDSHAHLTWLPPRDFAHAAPLPVVPLAQGELKRACPQLPLAFLQTADSWQVVALIGTNRNGNCILDSRNGYPSAYIPASLRAYPFSLGEGSRPLLCVDEGSGLVSNHYDGKPFFDASGALSPRLKTVRRFLRHLEKGRKEATHHITELNRLALLEPWNDARAVTGVPHLYRADLRQLQTLSPAAFLELQPRGRLQLFFAQSLSEQRFSLLEATGEQPADTTANSYGGDRRLAATNAVSELVQLMTEEGVSTDAGNADTGY